MFFETERLPHRAADDPGQERRGNATDALDALLPFQRDDFYGLFKAMDGLPVIIRLIDPPLHEFLPSHDELLIGGRRSSAADRQGPGDAGREEEAC